MRENPVWRTRHGSLPETPVGACRVCGNVYALKSDETVRLHLVKEQET